uniref:Uncharacterized protein n=1 Tax=Arundo donax TaxID=35708 RepID=A0A0A9C8K2_ARUDO
MLFCQLYVVATRHICELQDTFFLIIVLHLGVPGCT